MKDYQPCTMSRAIFRVATALLICSTICLPQIGVAQTVKDATPAKLETQTAESRYRSVITQLSKIEAEIFDLRNSEAQRDFEKVESTLFKLQAKRKQLDGLERKWRLLGDGKPAIEIEPRLNFSEQDQRQMLVELEASKEEVLRRKTELLKLNTEFGPGHPNIVETNKKLAELESVVAEQTEALEELGVEVKSSVAREKLQRALLRQAELEAKFGSGHPSVTSVESEIKMLQSEVLGTPVVATHNGPSMELINANLELREAGTKYGAGHPVCVTLKKKIEVLEKLAQSQTDSQAPINKEELAKRLAARIEVLQTRISNDETELDSIRDQSSVFKDHEEKTQALMKQRAELSSEMQRLSIEVQPEELGDEETVRVKQQLLSGIDALEFLGKSDEASRLREILGDLKK